MSTYLEELTVRLARGLGEQPQQLRRVHTEYLKAAQQGDGGFAGREGGSDLYYTGFALRALAILGELDGPLAARAADYLRARLAGQESVVDFLSLIYGAMLLESAAGLDVFAAAAENWRDSVAQAMQRLRRPDGGFAKGEEGFASSTYHTFLVLVCLQLIDRPVADPEQVVEFILSQRAERGGFREIRASKRAGTNPTAAGIGALRILDALDPQIGAETLEFLLEMQTDEGGLRANTRIPIADLLSTFTGTLTVIDLEGQQEMDMDAARRYAAGLANDTGGFHGAAWDPADDVEYTFYGLGCLALIQP